MISARLLLVLMAIQFPKYASAQDPLASELGQTQVIATLRGFEVPRPVAQRPMGAAQFIVGGALLAGGAVITGMCVGQVDSIPSACLRRESQREVHSGYQLAENDPERNLLAIAGVGVASTGAIVLLLSVPKKEAEAAETPPGSTENTDAEEAHSLCCCASESAGPPFTMQTEAQCIEIGNTCESTDKCGQ